MSTHLQVLAPVVVLVSLCKLKAVDSCPASLLLSRRMRQEFSVFPRESGCCLRSQE